MRTVSGPDLATWNTVSRASGLPDCASTKIARLASRGSVPSSAISFRIGMTRDASVGIRPPEAWMRRSMSGR